MALSLADLDDLADDRVKIFKKFLACQPPKESGEDLLTIWEELYNDEVKNTVVDTATGPSDDETNPVFPYEKLVAIVGDGGNWKWPRMWQKFDELERRGTRYRDGAILNYDQPNKNPNIVPQNVLIAGGGPVGIRMAIELVLGGHKVTIFEKRRTVLSPDGELLTLGFTNRINRPHIWPFVRNDLAKLNGKDFMAREACYPVFTEPDTSSIGIDELQCLLLKNALLLGVDFRLGVSYDDAKPRQDPKTCKPYWEVECTYDKHAAKIFNREEGKQKQNFDVLWGCDGPRSTVRDTQSRYFGDVLKKKFMDCVGIVANVKKCSRKRLRELGFEHGQEPHDMNRTKMIFKDFFGKVEKEADADLENIIYYKASFHNYVILTPKRDNLIKHGLSGKVYVFSAGRDAAAIAEQMAEKSKLKNYCKNVLKAAGIPFDPDAENEGFVDAPNDVMAFDFAECWNTKLSLTFNLPPANYDVDKDGPWMGRRLVPPVGLCGDALLEPFWPMGLGLKRGWQAIMDSCYVIDNLYNKTMFADKIGKDEKAITWEEHYTTLLETSAEHFELCKSLQVTEELGKGEYQDKGLVMTQLRKISRDAEKPAFEVEIDPRTRYAPLEKVWLSSVTYMKPEVREKWLHPRVSKAVAVNEFLETMKKGAAGMLNYEAKKIISVNGKVLGGKPLARKSTITIPDLSEDAKPAISIPKEEVAKKSEEARDKLASVIMSSKIEEHVETQQAVRRRQSGRVSVMGPPGGLAGMMDELAHVVPKSTEEAGAQERAEAMWDRAHEKNLNAVQQAELAHIRNMIESLTKSLEGYKKAEKDLMMSSRK